MPMLLQVPKIAALLSTACAALGAPYVPESDDVVLERIKSRPRPVREAQAGGNAQDGFAKKPSPQAIVAEVRAALDAANHSGDLRLLGRAEAMLALAESKNDPQLLIVKAALLQRSHRFEAALSALDEALAQTPSDPEGLLLKASILQVQGKFDAARETCSQLESASPGAVSLAANHWLDSLTGKAEEAFANLDHYIKNAGRLVERRHRLWIHGLLADMAWRLGRPSEAERHFKLALLQSASDSFLLNSYAEFLRSQKRPAEALALVERFGGDADWALLQKAMALKQTAPDDLRIVELTAELAHRFEAMRERKDRTHLREEAQFELEVRGNAPLALEHALENWELQREPIDALLVLQSAQRARDPAKAAAVIKWIRETGLQDERIQKLIREIES